MKEEIFEVIITVFVAVMTGAISAKITYHREIKKKIYEEREKTYINIFNLVEKLKKNPYLVFNSRDFLEEFGEINDRMTLYASEKVIDIIKPLNDRIYSTAEEYFSLFDSVEGQQMKENLIKYEAITDFELENAEILYMENHVIESEYVETILKQLIAQIRLELKIK